MNVSCWPYRLRFNANEHFLPLSNRVSSVTCTHLHSLLGSWCIYYTCSHFRHALNGDSTVCQLSVKLSEISAMLSGHKQMVYNTLERELTLSLQGEHQLAHSAAIFDECYQLDPHKQPPHLPVWELVICCAISLAATQVLLYPARRLRALSDQLGGCGDGIARPLLSPTHAPSNLMDPPGPVGSGRNGLKYRQNCMNAYRDDACRNLKMLQAQRYISLLWPPQQLRYTRMELQAIQS